MSTPSASVVVPTRGGADRLPTLFRALERQDTRDFEVIVVVDGNVDGSRDVVEHWARRGVPGVRAVVFPENRGRSTALNAGIAAARGRILIRCDDDLEPRGDFVSGHVAHHEAAEHPVGVIGPYVNVLPDTPFARVYGRAVGELALRDLLDVPESRVWRHWAGNVSIAATTAAAIGEYDTRYRRYGWEDVDYGYRLHRAGVRIMVDPCLAATHHMAATSTVTRAVRALHSGAARDTFVRLHGAEALPEHPEVWGAWGTIVSLTATMMTEPSVRTLGSGVDHLIRVLPPPVGRKLVALLVESAGVAGMRHPRRARTTF